MRVRAQDTVVVLSGNDRGKRGRVLWVDPKAGVACVEGVQRIVRHMRRSPRNPQGGGRMEKEVPVPLAKLQVVCPGCAKPTRLGTKVEKDRRVRVCRRCKTELG